VDELLLVDELSQRRDGVGDRDRGGPVEDHAHRSLLSVLPDEENRATEVRVEEIGPGDEQLSAERVHEPIVTLAGSDHLGSLG
jgi:hypothetical protein